MDKKGIFALAAKELSLTIEDETTVQIDDDYFQTTILIGGPVAKQFDGSDTKKISGSYGLTKKLSVQNAYTAALQCLENKRMVIVDDYNAPNVSRLKKELFCSNSWSMLFEYKADNLRSAVVAKNKALRSFLSSFDSFCQDASTNLALLFSPQAAAPPSKKRRRRDVAGPTAQDRTAVCERLSQSLMRLRTELLSLTNDTGDAATSLLKEEVASDKRSSSITLAN